MKYIFISVLLLVLKFAWCQEETDRKFTIEIVNNSKQKVYCSLSDVFTDSLDPGKTIKIERPVTGKNSIPGYLFIDTYDTSFKGLIKNSIQRIVYNSVKGRRIVINSDKSILLNSNYSETWLNAILKDGSVIISPEEIEKMIRDNPDDPASADLITIKYLLSRIEVDTIRHLYNLLTDRNKNSFSGHYISDYLKNRIGFKEGVRMEDFSLSDTSNTIMTLSGIKSKYVLIDFWFSHCGLCIESFPALIKLYNRTDRKNLEIIGISIDSKELAKLWKQTIIKNSIPWVCLLDPEYSISYGRYSIDTYPATILLDSSRHIIKIDPELDEIEKIIGN